MCSFVKRACEAEASLYIKNRRNLPIEVANPVGYEDTLNTEVTWNSVLDALLTLAESSGLGFSVTFNPEIAVETLYVYKGTDRSLDTSSDYVGCFSTSMGNVYDIELATGVTDFKNVAVVAGEGEGSLRAVKIVSLGTVTGENRREMYVDARDLQREYQVAVFTGNYD